MSKLAGVREKVHANLLQPLLVRNNCLIGCDHIDNNVLTGRLHLYNTHNFGQSLIYVKFFKLRLKYSSLYLCVVKCIVHVVEH